MKQTDRQHGADKVNSAGRWKWRKAIVTDSAEQDCHREVTPAAEARRGAGSQIMNLPKWIKCFTLQVELYIWNIISVLTSGCNKYFNPILLLNLMIYIFLFCPLTWGQIPGISLPLKLHHADNMFYCCCYQKYFKNWSPFHNVSKNKAATPKTVALLLLKPITWTFVISRQALEEYWPNPSANSSFALWQFPE